MVFLGKASLELSAQFLGTAIQGLKITHPSLSGIHACPIPCRMTRSRLRSLFTVIALLCVALVIPACAVRPDTEDFDVTLVNVAPGETSGGVGEASLRFTIRLQNANPQPVSLTGSAHRIHINGVYVGQALSNAQTEVPRLGTITEEVTVILSTFKLARALYGVYRDQSASYRITSTLYGSNSTFRTRKDGSIDLRALGDLATPNPGP